MIIGVGVDIIEIARIERAVTQRPRFQERVYTRQELIQCQSKGNRFASLAARFAAKEAVFKALGSGWQLGWQSVAVESDPEGRPLVRLAGLAAERADQLGVLEIKLSLTHSRDYAAAVAIALGGFQG